MLIMQYASEGDLHKYLQKKFTKITWNDKKRILYQISDGYLYFKYIIILTEIIIYLLIISLL